MGFKRRPPPTNAKSATWGAPCPDSAQTGYPIAFQYWNAKRRLWVFEYTGAAACGGARTTAADVQRQLEPDDCGDYYPAGWYRYVWVIHWIRTGGKESPWKACIDKERSSPAVWHPGGRE
jgi:hypothetical protein